MKSQNYCIIASGLNNYYVIGENDKRCLAAETMLTDRHPISSHRQVGCFVFKKNTMDRNLTFTKTITMITEVCCNCGILFGVPSDFQDQLRKTKNLFYCPNGHGQSYTKSKAEILQEKLDKEISDSQRKYTEISALLNSAVGEKNKLQKELKRVHNGVCPCCNRSFVNLQRHMKTKHPEVISNP